MQTSQSATSRQCLLIACAFFVLAVALSGVLPLWLDEILQLVETRGTTPAGMLHLLPRHPGAAPLGYLAQQAVFALAGYSVRLARLPSAIFAAGAVWLTGLFGAELGLKRPWAASALLAVFPLTLRYAGESRTYAAGLFFSVLASLLFARLAKHPSWPLTALYGLALIASVYAQPYALLVGVAHLAWAVCFRHGRLAARCALALVAAVAAFLPWYLWTRTIWVSRIAGAGVSFAYSAKTPLMLFRELVGAGYWGSGLLAILFVFALRAARPASRYNALLLFLIVVPSLLAVLGDSFFGYFVATRQIMWVLPAVAILAAEGFASLPSPKPAWLPALFAVCLLLACAVPDYRYFTGPREDWNLAAHAISASLRADGGDACLVVVPPEELRSYAFFLPELNRSRCPAPLTVVAITPYATAAQRQSAAAALAAQGYTLRSGTGVGKSQIDLYSR